jgi:hypothetical protein
MFCILLEHHIGDKESDFEIIEYLLFGKFLLKRKIIKHQSK